METHNSFLARFTNVKSVLAEIRNVSECIDLRNKAAAIETYQKAAGDCLTSQNEIAEIKIRLERKAGQLLTEMQQAGQLAKPGRPDLVNKKRILDHENQTGKSRQFISQGIEVRWDDDDGDSMVETPFDPPKTLSQLNIDRYDAARFKLMAAIPEDDFEEEILYTKAQADMGDCKAELTTNKILKLAKTLSKKEPPKPKPIAVEGSDCTPEASIIAAEAISKATDFKALMRKLQSIYKEIEALGLEPHGRYLDEFQLGRIKKSLHNVYWALKWNAPCSVCPYCRGERDNCDACRDDERKVHTGWVSYGVFKRIRDTNAGLLTPDDPKDDTTESDSLEAF